MPFYEEGNLDEAIEARDGKPFDLKYVIGLFMQLCRAIEHIHAKGIIHRDVKVSFLSLYLVSKFIKDTFRDNTIILAARS